MHAPKHHTIITLIVIFVIGINAYIFSKLESRRSAKQQPRSYQGGMLVATPTQPILDTGTTTVEQILPSALVITQKKSSLNFSPLTLLHFGDAMFDRSVRTRIDKGADVFRSLRELGIQSDYSIKMLNLEGPIIATDRANCQDKAYSFQFPLSTAKLLSTEGFTHVTIANNHILDCHEAGVTSTIQALHSAGLEVAGYPKLENSWTDSVTASGTSIALIGIDTTLGTVNLLEVPSLIEKLKATHDLVLVSVHWGEEYAPRANDEQRTLAHAWVDAGADVIVGNHPHVVENVENYKGHAIFYALGNFIFDQIGEKENEGVGVGMTLYSGSSEFMLYPYNIVNSVPTFLSPLEANKWCAKYLGVMPHISPLGCSFSLTSAQ